MKDVLKTALIASAISASFSAMAEQITYPSKYTLHRDAIMNGEHIKINDDGTCTLNRNEVLQFADYPYGNQLRIQTFDLAKSAKTISCSDLPIERLNNYEIIVFTSEIKMKEKTMDVPDGEALCFREYSNIIERKKITIADAEVSVPTIEITRKPLFCSNLSKQ